MSKKILKYDYKTLVCISVIFFIFGMVTGSQYSTDTYYTRIINNTGNIHYEIRTTLDPLKNYDYSDDFNCINFTKEAMELLEDKYYTEPLCVQNNTYRHAMIWVKIPVEPQTQHVYTKTEFDYEWNITDCSSKTAEYLGVKQ